jgi:hypothetical protein
LHRESEVSESRCFVVCISNIFRGVGMMAEVDTVWYRVGRYYFL